MNYDVIVLGTGISGSILATITARQGLSTMMIDHGRHPRFTVGESMIPGTSHMLRIMADRYDVPELDYVSTYRKLRRHVTNSMGIKRNFSFVHHTHGRRLNPKQSTMLPIPHYPDGPESHLMRQDVDAFLFAAAVRYGADALQDTVVTAAERNEDGWTLKTKCGRSIRGKYIVDGSGHNSVLAKLHGFREEPTRLRSFTRSIFTHMVGVRPFDDFYGAKDHGLPQPLSQGTLHHIFDGGWLWVIPFDNNQTAGNPMCSVGLQLDPRVYPPDPEGPEAEFRKFLKDYPDMAIQFEKARAVRPWVSAPRLQYSSTHVVGDRFCLAPHSAGFVDPLFSRGLHITMESINALAHRLIEAARTNDYSLQHFQALDQFTQKHIESHDKLTHGSLVAFRDFELWNAWYRVWALGGTLSSLRYRRARIQYQQTGDKRFLEDLEYYEHSGTPSPEIDEYQDVFNGAYAIMLDVEAGHLSTRAGIAKLYALYRNRPWIPPSYELTNPARRCVSPGDLSAYVKDSYWGYRQAPEEIRRRYFDFSPLALVKGVVKEVMQEELWQLRLRSSAVYARFDRYRSAQSPHEERMQLAPSGELPLASRMQTMASSHRAMTPLTVNAPMNQVPMASTPMGPPPMIASAIAHGSSMPSNGTSMTSPPGGAMATPGNGSAPASV